MPELQRGPNITSVEIPEACGWLSIHVPIISAEVGPVQVIPPVDVSAEIFKLGP